MKTNKRPKGYRYYVSDESIKEHASLTTHQKFLWLHQSIVFVHNCASKKTKRFHELFRRGKI